MKLLDSFKKIISSQQASENWSVFCFWGSSYPSLFFTSWREYISQRGLPLEHLACTEIDFTDLQATLEMSFLGQAKVYWLGDLSILDASYKKKLLPFLTHYRGPHKIICFLDAALQQTDAKESGCEVPVHCDRELFQQLFSLWYPEQTLSPQFVTKIFETYTKLSLDNVCNVLRYSFLLQGNMSDQNVSFLDKVIAQERSLFVLAQHFFAKESGAFFSLWKESEHDYPLEFWTAFFSEQLWQASLFLTQIPEMGPTGARKGITRLPFSFTQRDWKKSTLRELCAAHNFLYSVDYGSKNGYAEHGLEFFLWQFLQGNFARK